MAETRKSSSKTIPRCAFVTQLKEGQLPLGKPDVQKSNVPSSTRYSASAERSYRKSKAQSVKKASVDDLGKSNHAKPTYQLNPNKRGTFQNRRVSALMDALLQEHLVHRTYEASSCCSLAKMLSDEIIVKVKMLPMDRYKLICNVLIGPDQGQGIKFGSQCSWDTTSDNFATATYKNSNLFAVATVHGLYHV